MPESRSRLTSIALIQCVSPKPFEEWVPLAPRPVDPTINCGTVGDASWCSGCHGAIDVADEEDGWLAYVWDYGCASKGLCTESSGIYHFTPDLYSRVGVGQMAITLLEDNCYSQLPPARYEPPPFLPSTRFHDPQLHDISCEAPGCVHIEVNDHNGGGGRAVVVKVSDPNLSTSSGDQWWGCYLWTDQRECW